MSDFTPRILFVAFANSIHTVRWINQMNNIGWDIHLFPSDISPFGHPDFKDVIIHFATKDVAGTSGDTKKISGHGLAKWKKQVKEILNSSNTFPFRFLKELISVIQSKRYKLWWKRELLKRAEKLTKLVIELKPDIVHSLEIQHAGYLTQLAKKHFPHDFPLWIATNWGADIHYFGNMPEHAAKIRSVLESCDYYSCETQRDVQLARDFGFKGKILPVLPNTGGFDFQKTSCYKQPGPTSDRRVILLKGPNFWVYRGLIGIRALARCADVLSGYKIAIYLASPEIRAAATALSEETGILVEIIPYCSHEEMLRWHGRSRISIGLALSDGISTSFLEAIVMGSFPIQSNTGGAGDWIIDGETGILVPPEDTEAVEKAIRRAITDDELVNCASVINEKTVRESLDYEHVRSQVIAMYKTFFQEIGLTSQP